jgi:hypothetical protein
MNIIGYQYLSGMMYCAGPSFHFLGEPFPLQWTLRGAPYLLVITSVAASYRDNSAANMAKLLV